jgi:RimJ/RimL family protein N-acetyltransferase
MMAMLCRNIFSGSLPPMLNIPSIETKQLLLRPLELSDAEALYKIYCDPEAILYWGTPDRSLDESKQRIQRFNEDWSNGFGDWALVDKVSKKFVGFCGLHYISGMPEVNLGYLVDRNHWGKGFGTEASKASLDFGFQNCKMDQIVATTAPKNIASLKVLEKCGLSFWKKIERNNRERVVYSITRKAWDSKR